jgi:hypothetical protein
VPLRPTLSALLAVLLLALGSAGIAGDAFGGTLPEAALSIAPGTKPLQVKFVTQSSGFQSTVVTFVWTFGDGTSTTTKTPTVRHTYKKPGTYSPAVTEVAGGGQKATVAGTLRLVLCPVGSGQCSSSLTSTGPVDLWSAQGPTGSAAAEELNLFSDPWRFANCDSHIDTAVAVTDAGFTGPLTVTLRYVTADPSLVGRTCFASPVPFVNSTGASVTSGALPMCEAVSDSAPCVESIQTSGSKITKILSIPRGDPKVGAA